MRKSLLFLLLGVVLCTQTFAQVWYEPENATMNDRIVLYYDASQGDGGLKDFNSDVYMYTGVITAESTSDSDWKHNDGWTSEDRYKWVRSSDNPNLYYFSMIPKDFYRLSDGEQIQKFAIIFKDKDNNKWGKAEGGKDIIVPLANQATEGTGTEADTDVLCYYEASDATINDRITFFFDASKGNGAMNNYDDHDGGVFVHSGVITTDSNGLSDWKHSSGWGDNSDKLRLRRSDDNHNLYYFSFVPKDYFGLQDGEFVTRFVFVFRSENGYVQGKDTGDKDDYVTLLNTDGQGGGQQGEGAGQYVSHSYDNNQLVYRGSNRDLYLTPYGNYIIKVTSVPSGDTPSERNDISVCAQPQNVATVTDEAGKLVLSTSGMRAEIDKSNGKISFIDENGNLVLREKDGINNANGTKTISFDPMGDKGFYGGGYNGQRINHDNYSLVMDNTQTGGWSAKTAPPHNICIPFIVSSSGYGIYFSDHYRDAVVFPSSNFGTTYTSGSPSDISYYFIGGNGSMASVLENYTMLTGRQELPPYWALGYMSSRYGYKSQSEAKGVVETFKANDFPIDGLVFDLYWQGERESGMGNLDWYTAKFPDPEGMMSEFLQKGIHTICITEPYFTIDCTNYQTLVNRGYLADEDNSGMGWLGSSKVGLLDASNPAALDWMWDFYKLRTEEGVCGWWLDLGEPERHDEDSRHQGGSVSEVHNEFGNLWIESVYNGYKKDFPDVRPFLMPRAGTAGMQRLSSFPWTGDIERSWAGLQAQVPALVSSGMSGVAYMGNDVGGFAGDNAPGLDANGTNAPLYLRWIEFAVFSPMMRTHSPRNPEPYLEYYTSIFDDVRDFVNLRYRYLPYTYTLCYENAVSGMPLARPTNFYDVENGNANSTDSYLWGENIFVAPVVTDATSRSISFPAGEWVDMNDYSVSYAGGSSVNYDAPLDKLPYFGRKGSLITRYAQETFENTRDADNTEWNVLYLYDDETANSQSYVFEDDKTTTNTLQDGQYMLTWFEAFNAEDETTITISHEGTMYDGMEAVRTITFEIPGTDGKFASVSKLIDGVLSDMEKCSDKSAFDAAGDNVWFVDENSTIWVKTSYNYQNETVQQIILSSTPTAIDETGSASRFDFACIGQPVGTKADFLFTVDKEYFSSSIRIIDMAGSSVDTVDGGNVNAGTNIVTYENPGLVSGVYVAVLSLEDNGAVDTANCKFVVK